MINKEINTRTTITISKDLKSKIETLAKNNNRSMNNMIITILDSYIKENFDNKKQEILSPIFYLLLGSVRQLRDKQVIKTARHIEIYTV